MTVVGTLLSKISVMEGRRFMTDPFSDITKTQDPIEEPRDLTEVSGNDEVNLINHQWITRFLSENQGEVEIGVEQIVDVNNQ